MLWIQCFPLLYNASEYQQQWSHHIQWCLKEIWEKDMPCKKIKANSNKTHSMIANKLPIMNFISLHVYMLRNQGLKKNVWKLLSSLYCNCKIFFSHHLSLFISKKKDNS
jgi:hypothetical protein